MSRSIDSLTFMFPGIDEEAVEAAEGREDDSNRQQRKAQVGTASDRRDKGAAAKQRPTAISFGRRRATSH
jgi:hypothetical protein